MSDEFRKPGRKTILLVEDDKDVGWSYKEMLEDAGYAVTWMSDGVKVMQLKSAEVNTYDCIILDLQLNGLDPANTAHRSHFQED